MLVHCTDPHFVTLANLRDLHAPPPPPHPNSTTKFSHPYSPLPGRAWSLHGLSLPNARLFIYLYFYQLAT